MNTLPTGLYRQITGPFAQNEELINRIKAEESLQIESIGIQCSRGSQVLINNEKFIIEKEGILEFSQDKIEKQQNITSIKFLQDMASNTIIDVICK